MKRENVYQGGHLIGFVVIGVVALRNLLSFQGEPVFLVMASLLAAYTLLYTTEPWLLIRLRRYYFFYFPVQTVIVLAMSNLQPFTDMSCLLYVPLSIHVWRTFTRWAAMTWLVLYVILLSFTLIAGTGWLEGLALALLYLAVCSFVISFDDLYSRTQAEQSKSQHLLVDLQNAHRRLQEHAAQAEELAAARERNRLARELHDSVSQAIFSITLTSQSARLLLDRAPARVPEQIDRLQKMTEDALAQLRSLIAQLRPPQKT